jgi:hypothetical protein
LQLAPIVLGELEQTLGKSHRHFLKRQLLHLLLQPERPLRQS